MTSTRPLAVALLLASALAGAIAAAQGTTPEPDPADPLRAELQRCRARGLDAATDERCKAAARQSREQFLTPSSGYQPKPIDIFPKTGDQPAAWDRVPSDRTATPSSQSTTSAKE